MSRSRCLSKLGADRPQERRQDRRHLNVIGQVGTELFDDESRCCKRSSRAAAESAWPPGRPPTLSPLSSSRASLCAQTASEVGRSALSGANARKDRVRIAGVAVCERAFAGLRATHSRSEGRRGRAPATELHALRVRHAAVGSAPADPSLPPPGPRLPRRYRCHCRGCPPWLSAPVPPLCPGCSARRSSRGRRPYKDGGADPMSARTKPRSCLPEVHPQNSQTSRVRRSRG